MADHTKTLGILGGGQLGRMTAMAAARLGITSHTYSPKENSPAGQVAGKEFVGDYNDKTALKDFAQSVDAVTYEFENIPLETVRYIKEFCPVYPDDTLLEIAQDRIREKSYLNELGIPTAGWREVKNAQDLQEKANELHGESFIVKTTRFGYDGKGQMRYSPAKDDPQAVWESLGAETLIIEELVDFSCEISVIIARDLHGNTESYGPMLNEHKNHILYKTHSEAPLPSAQKDKALTMAKTLAEGIDLIGVMALEMFVGKNGDILANEIAPRPHNSGHWTIDACAVSQFEQQARAVIGLSVGKPGIKGPAIMVNLLGDDINDIEEALRQDGACVHLYGKGEARPGRKMGHITTINTISAQNIED